MQDLFKAEWLRFHRWAIAVALAHLGWLLFSDRVADPLQQPALFYQIYLGLLSLMSGAFGLYQVSAYAGQAAWIDLLHRPVAPRQIGTALLLAGLALIGTVVALPVALLLPFHLLTAGQGVETRHLLFPLAAWAIGTLGYLLGVHLRLGLPRMAWAALILLVWLYQADAFGLAAVALQLVAALIAFSLALDDFRPDRTAPEAALRRMVKAALAALAIAVPGTFALRFAFQIALMLIGNHPLNGVPPAGGLVEAMRADGVSLMTGGLQSQTSERNLFWSEQAALSEVVTIAPELREPVVRYALTSPGDSTIDDDESRLLWTFSHDTMRYAATSKATRESWRPYVLPPRLSVPPLVLGDGQTIVAGNRILAYQAATRSFLDRITLPASERLIAPPQPAWDRVAVLSDHALRIYDGRVMQLGDKRLPPIATMKLDGPPGALARIDLLELLDGYLVSLTYGQHSAEGRSVPEQRIWLLEANHAELILRRSLTPDYPAIMRHADMWFAPVLTTAASRLSRAFGAPNVLAETGSRSVPWGILALAALLHILCGIAAQRRCTSLAVNTRERAAWVLAALLLGPALLIAFHQAQRRKVAC